VITGDSGREAYTAIAWGVGLSHETICEIVSGLDRGGVLIGRARKSRMRPRQLSHGQLECLALPLFGIEDFDLEIWETPL
jgi:hypothetical protein